LLKEVGLENRLVQRDWVPSLHLLEQPIDYIKAEDRLELLREESMKFLQDALGEEGK